MKYYKQVETVRSKWVSGEIFVDVGLEAALNIDRDSFNEHEEHYKALQKYIHDLLDQVFDDSNKEATVRRTVVKQDKLDNQSQKFKEYVVEASDGQYELREDSKIKESIQVDSENGVILVNNNIQEIKSKKADQLYKIIEIAFQIAKSSTDNEDDRHDKFMELIKKALKEII